MGKDAQGPGTAQEPGQASSQQGSTLIEALLAVTLLGLAALTALQASTQATQRSRSAQQRAVASAALATGTAPIDDSAVVTAIPATPTTPAQWQVRLRWIDAADRRPASHHAVIERPVLPP